MNAHLINAVIENLGYDPDEDQDNEELQSTLEDIASHGIDGGYGGFTYYTDTIKFFKDNRKDIVDLCKEYAEEFGQDVISFVASFNCLEDDPETRDEIGRAIYGRLAKDDFLVPNALAWFAGEEVARHKTE